MFKRIFIVACLVSAAGLASAQAYKWVDENGVVHFSDRPQPGAERIELPESTRGVRLAVPRVSDDAGRDGQAEEQSEASGYSSIDIESPAAEETLWNIQGTLDVRVNLQPSLQPGHRIRVYYDGEPRMVSSTTFTLPEVWRGVHNLQVEVVNANGQVLIRSTTNRFYVQQTSVLSNNGPGTAPR